jgi:hypothetical protein
MAKKTVKKHKKDVWFTKVRGSYLPASWQAWLLYLVFSVYILGPLLDELWSDRSLVSQLTGYVTRILFSGIVMTWIAQKKS